MTRRAQPALAAGQPGSAVLVTGALPPPVHGASKVTALLVAALGRQDRAVRVFATSVPPGRGYHLRRAMRYAALLRLMCRERTSTSAVYQAGMGGLGLAYQLAVVVLGRMLRIPLVFHHHSFAYLDRRSRVMSSIVRIGGRRQTHLVLSDGMGARLVSRYGRCTTVTVTNAAFLGAASERVRPVPAPDGPFVIGHLSNLTMEKGLGVVLDAITLLRDGGCDVSLRLAGPAASVAVADRVRQHLRACPEDEWVGPVDAAEVGGFMAALDCFLFPSTYANEASPMVVLEALREGTPVVASDVGALPEMLDAAWIAQPRAEAVAAAARRVLTDPAAPQEAARRYCRAQGQGLDEQLRGVLFE